MDGGWNKFENRNHTSIFQYTLLLMYEETVAQNDSDVRIITVIKYTYQTSTILLLKEFLNINDYVLVQLCQWIPHQYCLFIVRTCAFSEDTECSSSSTSKQCRSYYHRKYKVDGAFELWMKAFKVLICMREFIREEIK